MQFASTLPAVPEPIKEEDSFFSLAIHYDQTDEQTHLVLRNSLPEYSSELLRFCFPYKREGQEYLRGHPAYFCLSLPYPGDYRTSARLHIAVPFIDISDLESGIGLEHRQDFDRLMDIVQQVIVDMVKARVIEPGKNRIDIITETLSASGELEIQKVNWASFAVGATWLTYNGKNVFSDYRWWDSENACWKTSEE